MGAARLVRRGARGAPLGHSPAPWAGELSTRLGADLRPDWRGSCLAYEERRVAACVASSSGSNGGSRPWLNKLSERDYPEGEIVLGIEMRKHSVKAALVDTGCGEFVRPGVVKSVDADAGLEGYLDAVRKVVEVYNWRGPVGCSVTRQVKLALGNQDARGVLCGALPSTRGEIAIMIHTDAAAYAEMLCGAARCKGGKILVVTVGKNMGAVLYSDGEKMCGLDLTHLIWNWELELQDIQRKHSFTTISPKPPLGQPGPGGEASSKAWSDWVALVSKFLCKACAAVRPNTVVVMPTGSAVKQPRRVFLEKLCEGMPAGTDVVVGARPEGAIIRGAAIGAHREFRTFEAATQLKRRIQEHLAAGGRDKSPAVSSDELMEVFGLLDADGDGAISFGDLKASAPHIHLDCSDAELQGIMNCLVGEVAVQASGTDFRKWWREVNVKESIRHVMSQQELGLFLDQSQDQPPRVLMVSAKGCKACQKMGKVFQDLALERTSASFAVMNMDTNRSTWQFCKDQGITRTPAFLFYKGGRVELTSTTTQPVELREHLSTFLESTGIAGQTNGSSLLTAGQGSKTEP